MAEGGLGAQASLLPILDVMGPQVYVKEAQVHPGKKLTYSYSFGTKVMNFFYRLLYPQV